MHGIDLFRSELVSTDDTGDLQQVAMLGYAGEQLSQVMRVQPHGFASVAPAGSHGIGMALRGVRRLAVALGFESPGVRQRNLAMGNTAVYDAQGNVTSYLGTDGIWHNSGAYPQQISGSTVAITGTQKVTITVGSTTVTIQNGRIDLGASPAPYAVVTTNGPSATVFSV